MSQKIVRDKDKDKVSRWKKKIEKIAINKKIERINETIDRNRRLKTNNVKKKTKRKKFNNKKFPKNELLKENQFGHLKMYNKSSQLLFEI